MWRRVPQSIHYPLWFCFLLPLKAMLLHMQIFSSPCVRMYRFPDGRGGLSGPTKSTPMWCQVDLTGIGCSSGLAISSYLDCLWHVSVCHLWKRGLHLFSCTVMLSCAQFLYIIQFAAKCTAVQHTNSWNLFLDASPITFLLFFKWSSSHQSGQ